MSGGFATLYQLVTIATAMCVAMTILLALPDGRVLARGGARGISTTATALLGIFVVALALRGWLAPHSLFHDHNHGYGYLRVMLGTGPHTYRLEYGIGGFNTFRLFLQLLPTRPESVFWLNAVFGALTVLPVYALASGLWRSRRAGLFAAFAIAVLPPHIRLSGTEDLYVLAGLFEATALAAMVAYLRNGAARHLALAVAAVVVCVSVRETMNLLPFVCIAYVLWLVPGARRRLADRRLWLGAATAVVLGLPHIVFFARYSLADFSAQAPLFDARWVATAAAQMASRYNVYLDPAVVFPSIGALAAVGVVSRFRDHRRPILITCGALLVFMGVAGLKSLTDSDRVMFHAHYGVYIAVLVGRGCTELVARLARRRREAGVTIALAAVLAATPLLALGFLRHRSNIQREFQCVNGNAARVPAGCRLVTLTNGRDVGAEPIGVQLTGLPRFRDADVMSIGSYLSRLPRGDACYVYYEQRICYEPSMAEVFRDCGLDPETLHYPDMFRCIARYRAAHGKVYQRACRRMHETRRLEPLATCRFSSAPLDVDPMQPGRDLELGYYYIRGVRATPGAGAPDKRPRSDPAVRR